MTEILGKLILRTEEVAKKGKMLTLESICAFVIGYVARFTLLQVPYLQLLAVIELQDAP